MFLKGWPVKECTTAFEKQADVAFRKPLASIPLISNIPLISTVGELIAALFNDAIYRAKHLEGVLKETLGSDMKMQDSSYATTIGAKIGLPVATVSEASTLLFTNYNGRAEGASRLGMCDRPCMYVSPR
jgi:hypothetical protein